MSRTALPFTFAAIVGAVVMAIAFAAAPYSCEGGLTLYFWSGVGSLAVLAALPFFLMAAGKSVLVRLAWAVGFFGFGVAVWFAGLFLANVRIMCRLF
jgi:hypothetical protein